MAVRVVTPISKHLPGTVFSPCSSQARKRNMKSSRSTVSQASND
jgi:hypothetical protein